MTLRYENKEALYLLPRVLLSTGCSWELCPSWKTMGNIKPNAKKSLFFTPVFLLDNYFHFQWFALAWMHNHCGSKSKWWWVTMIPLLHNPYCPLPGEVMVIPPFSHLQRSLDWLAPAWKVSDVSSEWDKMLSLSPILRARLWLRMESGCPAFLDDPVPGQPEGNANYQSLCGIAFKWKCLVPVKIPTTWLEPCPPQ